MLEETQKKYKVNDLGRVYEELEIGVNVEKIGREKPGVSKKVDNDIIKEIMEDVSLYEYLNICFSDDVCPRSDGNIRACERLKTSGVMKKNSVFQDCKLGCENCHETSLDRER